jgi:hypothetical protein
VPYSEIANDFLFSFNIVLLDRLINANTLSSVGPELQLHINNALGLDPDAYVGGYIAFVVFALGIAVVLCGILWTAASFVSTVVRLPYGIVSIAALPVVWISNAISHRIWPGLPNPPKGWLLLEVSAVVISSVLFLVKRWPLPNWATLTLLCLHFALWGWLFMGGVHVWLAPAKLIFPLASLASCIAWGIYVARRPSRSAMRG